MPFYLIVIIQLRKLKSLLKLFAWLTDLLIHCCSFSLVESEILRSYTQALSLNPLSPNSGQHQISPRYNYQIQFMRIKELIAKD